MSANTQNISKDVNTVGNLVNGITKAATSSAEAFSYFLSTRSSYDNSARILYSHVKNGGNLRCMELDGKIPPELSRLMESSGLTNVKACVRKDGHNHYIVLYRGSQEELAKHIRETYLVANRKIFHCRPETLKSFSPSRDLAEYRDLSYAEMRSLQERAVKNGIMFTAGRSRDGSYTAAFRREDHEMSDVLMAGIRQEKEGSGKNLFAYIDASRKEKEDAVNRIVGAKGKKLILGDPSGKVTLYTDKDGIYVERAGKGQGYRFIGRHQSTFERDVCRLVDQMRDPTILDSKEAAEYGERIKENTLDGKQTVMDTREALSKFGYQSIKKLDKETLKERMEKHPEYLRDREMTEAYYKLQRTVDLFHTSQEGVSKDYPKETEKKVFDAEHQVRMEYEFCLNHGDAKVRQAAGQYISGEISMDQAGKFAKDMASDIRKNMDWREPFDIPDYLDINSDNILDDFQKEEFLDYEFRDPAEGGDRVI